MNTLERSAPLYVAGHRGMVGSAIVRRLQAQGYTDIVTATHAELDLTDPEQVCQFFGDRRIGHVVLPAAKVGAMPTNLCEPGDNFHPEDSHLIPALPRRCHDAVAAVAAKGRTLTPAAPHARRRHPCVHID
jgi:nucleoside-diphosphate-sugar epimerase